ncbi:hypothetical protein [Paraburkholderia bannensis]|uniref:hypothetical protein n=1 Tax=Paraburkholderia bannensis TaxID=765414 RepID=UPI002AB1153A|nr:hypothetical protein [Paraburkholderia bannensis]
MASARQQRRHQEHVQAAQTPKPVPLQIVAPPVPEAPTRTLPLPARCAQPLTRVEGVPDLLTTRLVSAVMLLFCVGFGVGLAWAIAIDKTITVGPVLGLLLLLLYAVLVWMGAIAVDALVHAGAWFVVDETGFRYGFGKRQGAARTAVETRVDWQNIVVNPRERYDVSTDFATRQALVKNLLLWQRKPSGDVVQTSLRLGLAGNDVLCLRFHNRAEVVTAILAGLARRPGLRFDSEVFVDAGVNPETFAPMKSPRRIEYTLIIACCLAMFAFIYRFADTLPAWLLFAGSFGILVGGCGVLAFAWQRRYPGLTGTIGYGSTPELTPELAPELAPELT